MRDPFARVAAAALTVAVLAPVGANADSLDQIQGAWVVQDMNCSDVFATDQGKTTFKKRQDDTLPGFIVGGRNVRGRAGDCRIGSFKPHPDGISLLLSCTSQISFVNLKVTLKIPDPNTLIQADPDFPEITTTYHKCK